MTAATAGIWMLAGAGLLMLGTGMPTWCALLAVSLLASGAGVALGAFPFDTLALLPARLLALLDSDLLQALPMYVFIGCLLNRLPLSASLFRTAMTLLRQTRARAPLSGLFIGTLLAPMNGSAGAGVSLLARLVYPRLLGEGLPPSRSAALVAVGGTLGVVIPPSLVLLLLSDAMLRAHTEAINVTASTARVINIQDVFRGALPAALLVVAFSAVVAWWTNRRPTQQMHVTAPPTRGADLLDWLRSGLTVLAIAMILGAVTVGALYAVEGAALGGVLLLGYGVLSGSLTRRRLLATLRESMVLCGALFAVLVAATTFTLVVRAFGTDRWVATALGQFQSRPEAVLAIALCVLVLCSLVLDAFEMMFVVIPIVAPPLLVHVPDATWVAVLILLIIQASFLAPPMGYSLLITCNRLGDRIAAGGLARAVLPYLAAHVAVLVLVLAWPSLTHVLTSADTQRSAPVSEEEFNAILRKQLDGDSE